MTAPSVGDVHVPGPMGGGKTRKKPRRATSFTEALDNLIKFNHNHDNKGRFSTAQALARLAKEPINQDMEPPEGAGEYITTPFPVNPVEYQAAEDLYTSLSEKKRKALGQEEEKHPVTLRLDQLHSMQFTVQRELVAHFIQHPEPMPAGHKNDRGFHDAYPHAVLYQGKYFLIDGNHRLSAAYYRGEKTAQVAVINLDTLKIGKGYTTPAPVGKGTPQPKPGGTATPFRGTLARLVRAVGKFNPNHDQRGRFATAVGGPALESWGDHPTTTLGWQQVEGQGTFPEPPLPNTDQRIGAGVIIKERDGRVWLVAPTNGYGGYDHTFPKGTVEDGLDLRQTAIKEAYEETGLKVKLTGFFGDYERTTSIARYYTAERVGGHPDDHGWESEGVKLVRPSELQDLLNKRVDKPIAEAIVAGTTGATVPSLTANDILQEKVGGQGGSNAGGFYKGADGLTRYVKFYKNPIQSSTEHLANAVYGALHLAAPRSMVFDSKGQVAYASRVINPLSTLEHLPLTKERATAVLKGFAADVLTGNWDAVGLTHDNVGFRGVNGKAPYRLDNGGSFTFRAKAGMKDPNLLHQITEWQNFANPSINPAYAKIFKTAGIKGASEIPGVDKQVADIVRLRDSYGGWNAFVTHYAPRLTGKDKNTVVDMLEARTHLLKARVPHYINKIDPYHEPPGSPKGGQFAHAPGFDESKLPFSAGTSSMPKLYNKSLQQIAAAFSAADPIAAIMAIKGPPLGHSFGVKFQKIKAEALALAEAQKQAAIVPPPPKPGTLALSQPNKTKWNNGLLDKLEAASQSSDPITTLAAVSISSQAHPTVKAYQQALLQFYGQPNPNAATAPPVPAKKPLPTSLSFDAFAPMTTIYMSGQQHALVSEIDNAYANQDLKALSAISTPLDGYNPSQKIADYKSYLQSKLTDHLAGTAPGITYTKPAATAAKPKPPSVGISVKELTGTEYSSLKPASKKVAAKMLNAYHAGDLAALQFITPGGPTTTVLKDALIGKLKAFYGTVPVTTLFEPPPQAKPQSHIPTKENFVEGTHHAADILTSSVAGKYPKPSIPSAPALDTSFPAEQQALFSKKVKQLQDAYHSADPGSALGNISAYSPSLSKYKSELVGAINTWEASKPVEPSKTGDTVSTWKIVADAATHEVPSGTYPILDNPSFHIAHSSYRHHLGPQETKVLDSYKGSGYHNLNESLRQKPDHITPSMKVLDKVLHGMTLGKSVMVTRNIHSEGLVKVSQKLVGRIVEDPAYMSTSLNGGFGHGSNVSLHLGLPADFHGVHFDSEHEIVLPRRTRYRIYKVSTVAHGGYSGSITHIYAEALPVNQQKGWYTP